MPFDEMYGNEASRILINNSLKKANHLQSRNIGNELGNVGRAAINERRQDRYHRRKHNNKKHKMKNIENSHC